MCEGVLASVIDFISNSTENIFQCTPCILTEKSHFAYMPSLAFAEYHIFTLVTLVTRLSESVSLQAVEHLFPFLLDSTSPHDVIVYHSLV